MGEKHFRSSDDGINTEEITLHVDDRGRVTLPKNVREQLGIKANDTIPARLIGSVLTVNPRPSKELETASADRDDWKGTTPTDAGDALFGSMELDKDE